MPFSFEIYAKTAELSCIHRVWFVVKRRKSGATIRIWKRYQHFRVREDVWPKALQTGIFNPRRAATRIYR